jgi:hypothetical protein
MAIVHLDLWSRWTNNSPWIDMSPHSDTLSWFRVNQFLIFLLIGKGMVTKRARRDQSEGGHCALSKSCSAITGCYQFSTICNPVKLPPTFENDAYLHISFALLYSLLQKRLLTCPLLKLCWTQVLFNKHRMQVKCISLFNLTWLFTCTRFIDWCCYYTQVSYTGSWEPLVLINMTLSCQKQRYTFHLCPWLDWQITELQIIFKSKG